MWGKEGALKGLLPDDPFVCGRFICVDPFSDRFAAGGGADADPCVRIDREAVGCADMG